MAQKKRGPGRPKWVVKRQEVQHSEESAQSLNWWQAYSGEYEGSAAVRRALNVLRSIRSSVLDDALRRTER